MADLEPASDELLTHIRTTVADPAIRSIVTRLDAAEAKQGGVSSGDLIEWAGGACLTAAAYFGAGTAAAFAVAGAFLIYQAQCLAGLTVRLPFFRKDKTPNE